MVEFFDNFVKFFTKLDDYYILRQEKEHLIVGTRIIIKEHKEFLGNIFCPRTENIDKELDVFFLISIAEKAKELDKLFIQRNLPLLSLNNKKKVKTLEEFQKILDRFVDNNFYY